MLTSFEIIQKKRSHSSKNKGTFTTNQGMKEIYLQGRILCQVKAILSCIKLLLLLVVTIVKIWVIKLSIARFMRIISQDIGPIVKASHVVHKNKVKSRPTIHFILYISIISNVQSEIILVRMRKIVHLSKKGKSWKRKNPLWINVV